MNPAAAGDVSLTTDFPQLKGPSTSTFTFNLTLHNDTAEDLTFTGVATGPAGWTVSTQVSSETQAASAIVKAGSTTPVTITASAPDNVVAGDYAIAVDVSSGTRKAHQDLAVTITGSYKLTLTTPDGRLNASASAGSASTITLQVENDGTAVVEGAKLTGSLPNGWTVTFDKDTVDVPPGTPVQVVATLTPSGDAIAGDYVTSFKATADTATRERRHPRHHRDIAADGCARRPADRPRPRRAVVGLPHVRAPLGATAMDRTEGQGPR